MVKIFSKFVFILLCSFFFSSCNLFVNKNSKAIKDAALELQKACPLEIDYLTTLDKVEYKSPKTIVLYSTTNINLVKTDINALKEDVKSNIIYEILHNNKSDFKTLKDAGVIFHYIYKTQAGKEYLNITFGPEFYLTQETNQLDYLTDKQVFKSLEEISSLQNSQLPRQIDESYTLQKIKAIEPRTLEYLYRLEVPMDDIDTVYLNSYEAKQDILNEFLTAKDTDKMLKDNKVTFRFTYEDEKGVPITSIDITPDDYN